MRTETQKKIKDNLEAYDVILLIGPVCNSEDDLAERLINSQAFHESGKKVLVLPADECEDLAELYYTYEFSDRIRMIDGNSRHGSLMNYVALGLLTEQEMVEAILR